MFMNREIVLSKTDQHLWTGNLNRSCLGLRSFLCQEIEPIISLTEQYLRTGKLDDSYLRTSRVCVPGTRTSFSEIEQSLCTEKLKLSHVTPSGVYERGNWSRLFWELAVLMNRESEPVLSGTEQC